MAKEVNKIEEFNLFDTKAREDIKKLSSQFKDITKNKVDKTNLEYINVLDLGIAPKVNFDNTSLFNDCLLYTSPSPRDS